MEEFVPMRRVCAWCKEFLGGDEEATLVAHTICEPCRERELAQAAADLSALGIPREVFRGEDRNTIPNLDQFPRRTSQARNNPTFEEWVDLGGEGGGA